MNVFGTSALIKLSSSFASKIEVSIIVSNAAVGIAKSSLDNHSWVDFPFYTICPLTDLSRFSFKNIKLSMALRFSCGVSSVYINRSNKFAGAVGPSLLRLL